MLKKFVLLILVSVIILFYWWVFAEWDCNLLEHDIANQKFVGLDKISNIFPNNDIKTALQHLVYFCCENEINSVEYQKKYCPPMKDWKLVDKKLYAESPYLYDQLLDIWFRRLDWDPTKQYSTAWLDKLWEEWRKYIQTASSLVEWIAPVSLLNKFKEYWKVEIDESLPDVPDNIDEIKTNWNNYWLKNRYLAMCYVSKYIEDYIKAIYWPFNFNDKALSDNNTKKCVYLAKHIVDQEINYFKWVMIQQAWRFIAKAFSTYTDDYFTRGRLQDLLEEFSLMQSDFFIVNQKVNKATNQCSK